MIQFGSPFHLLINGTWVALEGVEPGVSVTPDRPRGSFVSVGGVRHSQQARRAPRTWAMSLPYADALTLRLLEVACELPEVWLHDSSAAAVNMLRPVDSYGPPAAPGVLVVEGVPLREYASGTVSTQVRAGVLTFVTCWTTLASGATVATVTRPGGTSNLTAPAGTGVRRASMSFTPSANGVLTANILGAGRTGMQVTEGAAPTAWAPGRGTPCRVVVQDPERSLDLIRSGEVLAGASVTLEEVG